MSERLFVGMVALFWVAELAFGSLVAYWFVTQGFDSDADAAAGSVAEIEDRAYTLKSLGMWGVFFALVLIGIVVGA
jgi:hypothetical protein